ncbi:MAG: thioesterase family protein [Fimbriimonadaceae bacterium]|nr:thioesterase family protein [Alphaproteobacteria bacterium]
MTFDAPYVAPTQTVEPEWIDYNGHLNMAFYNVLFDRCVDHGFELLGLGPSYLKETGASFFTLEAHVTYLRELPVGAPVRATLQVLDFDEKRIHCFQELYHDTENFLSATSETMALHIDMTEKRSSPFPPEILSNIRAMHGAHKSLERKPQVGHVIGIPQKAP